MNFFNSFYAHKNTVFEKKNGSYRLYPVRSNARKIHLCDIESCNENKPKIRNVTLTFKN